MTVFIPVRFEQSRKALKRYSALGALKPVGIAHTAYAAGAANPTSIRLKSNHPNYYQ